MKREESVVDVNEFLERLMTPERLRKQSVSTIQSTSLLHTNNNFSTPQTQMTMDTTLEEDPNLTVRLEDFGGLFDDLGANDDGGYSSVETPLGTLLHPSTSLNVVKPIKSKSRSIGIVMDEEIMLDAKQMFKELTVVAKRGKRARVDYSRPFDSAIWDVFYPSTLPPTPNKTPTKAKPSSEATTVIQAGNFVLARQSSNSISISNDADYYNYPMDDNINHYEEEGNRENEFGRTKLDITSDASSLSIGESFLEKYPKGVTARKRVCRGFHRLLEMANDNRVRLFQSEPFADISIKLI